MHNATGRPQEVDSYLLKLSQLRAGSPSANPTSDHLFPSDNGIAYKTMEVQLDAYKYNVPLELLVVGSYSNQGSRGEKNTVRYADMKGNVSLR
jgi:hypothetical protein